MSTPIAPGRRDRERYGLPAGDLEFEVTWRTDHRVNGYAFNGDHPNPMEYVVGEVPSRLFDRWVRDAAAAAAYDLEGLPVVARDDQPGVCGDDDEPSVTPAQRNPGFHREHRRQSRA